MNEPQPFVRKFAPRIGAVLSCHDRVICTGSLPFGGDAHLNRFVANRLKMRRKDCVPFVEQQSDTLVAHAKAQAAQAGAPSHYRQGKHGKEPLVQAIRRERPPGDGLVAVLCCQETCPTVKLRHGQGRPRRAFARRPQRVLSYYFLDPDCGLLHVRWQSWFPFTVQVYVNGHDGLARQLLQRRLGFVQQDNAFTPGDDPRQTQERADRFPRLAWTRILDRWARAVNPLLGAGWLGSAAYSGGIDQAEYSTDLLFRTPPALADLYPALLDPAALPFSAADLLSVLGRRRPPLFDGQVLTTGKKDRTRGARVKHRVKNTWLKLYDQFGQILRLETVINQPREFKVRRWRQRRGQRQLRWCPMNQGVANFYHYHEGARAATDRYLRALTVVPPPSATAPQVDRVSEPVRFPARRRRGLNLLRRAEQHLFRAVRRGEHRLHGFRNRDVAGQLFASPAANRAERRRRTASVSRQLPLLRAHGLIAKIPRSHRYRVTPKGEAIMSAAI